MFNYMMNCLSCALMPVVVGSASSIPAAEPSNAATAETAESEQVDVIVMGTHGRRGITALLMGSVAEAVVRRAKCPVFVVKDVPKST